MLEILYIEWFTPLNSSALANVDEFPHNLRAIYLQNIQFDPRTLFFLPNLEILSITFCKWSLGAINASLIHSPYLRISSLQNTVFHQIPTSICRLSHLQI